jgi:hypothetical protein
VNQSKARPAFQAPLQFNQQKDNFTNNSQGNGEKMNILI